MNRKSLLVGSGVFLLLTVAASLAVFLVRHEPDFYRKTALPPGQTRVQHSQMFRKKFFDFIGGYLAREGPFGDTFTNEQINSYLVEDFEKDGNKLPEDISDPRLAVEAERVRLGFRYGKPPWSTIISVDLNMWLVPPETIALEIQGMWKGALPISAHSLLEKITTAAGKQNIEISWYRYNGHPVALLRYRREGSSGSIQLQDLKLHAGEIYISGSTDNMPLPAPAPVANQPQSE